MTNYDSGERQTATTDVWKQNTMNIDSNGKTQWTTVCRIKIIKNKKSLDYRQMTYVVVMTGSVIEINVFNIKVKSDKEQTYHTEHTDQIQRMVMNQYKHSVMLVTFHP